MNTQTDRQTFTQTVRHTDSNINKPIHGQMLRQIDRLIAWIHEYTDRQTDFTQTVRHTDSDINKPICSDAQIDR